MKILYHHRTMAEDAQGIHISEMIRAFESLGHRVEVFSLVRGGGREQQGEVSLLGRIKDAIPGAMFELAEIAYNLYAVGALLVKTQKKRPDFIYERYALYNAAGVIVSRLTGIPLIVEVNAPLAIEKQQHGKLFFPRVSKWFEKMICTHATRTLAVTTSLKNILIGEGVPEECIYVMHNGIRREVLSEKAEVPVLRRQLGISTDTVVLGFVGWFRPWHGLDRLIDIFHDNHLGEAGASLLLVGGGPIYDELVARAKGYGLLNRSIFFTGPLPHGQVYEYIKIFDIALQPAVTSYASPMKIFEYLGLGKPVIAPRQENISEILTDGYDSWLFESDNSLQFARVVQDALHDRSEIRLRSANARATIVDRDFFWEGNAKRTIALLSEAHSGVDKCVA